MQLSLPALSDSEVKFEDAAVAQKPGTLIIEFLDDSGSRRTVIFTRGRLGIALVEEPPTFTHNYWCTLVGRVVQGGHADELGVKVGWRLLAIQGEDVSQVGANPVRGILGRRCKSLPDAPECMPTLSSVCASRDV